MLDTKPQRAVHLVNGTQVIGLDEWSQPYDTDHEVHSHRPLMISGVIAVVATIAVLPVSHEQLGASSSFLTAMLAVVACFDVMSIYLLLGDYRSWGDPRLLVMTWAYAWSLVLMGAYALAFPGAVSAHPVLALTPSMAPYFYILWHCGFPLMLAAAWAPWPHRWAAPTPQPRRRLISAVTLTVTVIGGAMLVAGLCAAARHLPVLIHGFDTHRMTALTAPFAIPLVFLALAVTAWGTRDRAGPERWTTVTVLICVCDLSVTYYAGSRYSAGWYFGRSLTLVAAAVVLLAMLTQVVGKLHDRTVGMKIEQERTVFKARLAEAKLIEERAKLENQLHQAQRLETVGQLAGGIAHDFNNLLAGITGFAGLVSIGLDELASRSADEDGALTVLSQDVNEIVAGAKRAAELTRQLLIFSRREVVRPTVLDLNSVVADMEKLLGRTIGERIELRCAMAPDVPRILADRGQVEQILMNLAVNARHAMADQGQLCIETGQVELAAEDVVGRILAPGSYVRLTVSDTGTGMTPEVIDRAFEPFFSTKPKDEGSGLGLATVYGIATQAGGDVAIDSEIGLGTSVQVLFPATTEAFANSGAGEVRHVPIGRGETILLVEDEKTVREPARRILARNGYTVLSAANADEALEIVSRDCETINLLLTDVVMPGRSGKDLAGDVRALVPRITVLYMSGHSGDVLAHEEVLNDGVTLMEKPFTAEVLLCTVRATLDGVRL